MPFVVVQVEVVAGRLQSRATHRRDNAHNETEQDRIERPEPGSTCSAKGKAGAFTIATRAELQRQAPYLTRATQLRKLSGQVAREHKIFTTNKRRRKI